MKLSPEKFIELTEVKRKAKEITQLSFNLSQLEKMYPLDSLDDKLATSVVLAYKRLLNELK